MLYQGHTLDRFQEEAARAIDGAQSLIVAAPTGCGKTLIAEYAVDKAMAEGKRVIYTAPIKALSNQKYRDFRKRFGADQVGIHTGDVSLNPHAPLLIMTTEIFRNLILEGSSRLKDVFYAIFDEIHYLDDPERGTVWEESIILAPLDIRFMCLSATVPNLHELAQWMSTVRQTTFAVIEETTRPVPLHHALYSAKYGEMRLKDIGRYYKKNESQRKEFLRKKPSSLKIVSLVTERKQLPVLYFCFNRRACENNALLHSNRSYLTSAERDRASDLVADLINQYKLHNYDRLDSMIDLWEAGVAYHHAGILPAAKEIVERLFTEGLIKLLFCTETFALGVNMPASAVIFDELEKFNGVEFSYMMTRNYNQIAGRAGRRGMDSAGFVYSQIIPEATDPVQVNRILNGTNEIIQSRFCASYSTILTLYSNLGEEAFVMFRKSLRNFKKGTFALSKSYQKEEHQIRQRIKFLQDSGFLNGRQLTDKGRLAAAVNGYEIQAAELYYSRSLDECSAAQLPVVFAALVTEESRSRKKNIVPSNVTLKFHAENVIHKLRQKETRHLIDHPIRELDFSLAAPMHAWSNGCTLKQLENFGVPEGDLVRILRMTVQLLRTMREQLADPVLAERMQEALELINRDIVDAQAELAIG